MNVFSNNQRASAVGLVRPSATPNGWVVADNDMNAVFVWKRGRPAFRPLVQALFLKTTQQRVPLVGVAYAEKYASRCYMGSAVDMPDGGVIVEVKFGVKEVEDAGIPFKAPDSQGRQCAWGMYLIRLDSEGRVIWQGRYQIHKGNAMVVPGAAGQVRLIATDGLCWVINTSDGAVVSKTKVPMGASGEKCFANATGCSSVGYTGHASTVTRFGIDTSPIPVQSKPPYDIGADEWRCSNCSPRDNPSAIWWAMVLKGRLLYNYVGPRMKGRAKHPVTKVADGGPADAELRHPVALFQIPNEDKKVGVALKDEQQVWVQVLSKPSSRLKVGPGAWPTAVTDDVGTSVYYFNNGFMYEALIEH